VLFRSSIPTSSWMSPAPAGLTRRSMAMRPSRSSFAALAGTFEDYRWEVKRLTDIDTGAVLVVARETGRGKGSGVQVDRSLAALYTVIDGKIAHITTFRTEQDALEAAGLRE
jgi:ketosteroid isomerase-like protein